MMKLDQLPKDCRSFIASEAKKRNQPEQAVLDHYVRLIDETDAEIEEAFSRLTGRGRKRTSPDRLARWHGHIKTRLDRVIGLEWFMPPEAVAEIERIEGAKVDEIVLARLCARRGWGVTEPTVEQANYFEQDNEAEEWPTRCRNRRERDAADGEILHLITLNRSCTEKLTAEEIATLTRNFYRAGDANIGPAVGRLVKWYAAHKGVRHE